MSGTARLWLVRMLAVSLSWVLLGSGQCVQAGAVVALLFQAVPSPPNAADASPAYDGTWWFTINTTPTTVTLSVVSGPTAALTTRYMGDTYTYMATANMGVYTFSGTAFSTTTTSPYNLGVNGTFNSKTGTLTLGDAPGSYLPTPAKTKSGVPILGTLTSQRGNRKTGKTTGSVYEYYVLSIKSVPEPQSAVLSLFALGTLAGSSTLTCLLKRIAARKRDRNGDSA